MAHNKDAFSWHPNEREKRETLAKKDRRSRLMLHVFQEFPILCQTCLGSNPYIRMVSLFCVSIYMMMIFIYCPQRQLSAFLGVFNRKERNFKKFSRFLPTHSLKFEC